MTKNKFFKQFVVLLALIAAGAQGALAQTPNFTVDGVGYSSYLHQYNPVTSPNTGEIMWYIGNNRYASVMSYTSPTETETLTIPDTIYYDNKAHRVVHIGCYFRFPSGNSSGTTYNYNDVSATSTTVNFWGVKTLTIQGKPTLRGTINLPDAETLVLEKSFSWNSPITCPKLTEIHFKGSTPSLSGSGSQYFADGRISQITAYVAGKTREECNQMKQTAVWREFKDVKPYHAPGEREVNVYVTAERAWVNAWGENNGSFNTSSIASSGSIQSKTFTISKNSDFRVQMNKYGYSDHAFRRILVNGKDVSNELTWSDDYAWSGEYFIRDITEDTYIHIDGETKTIGTKMFMTVSEGGSVTVTVDGKTHSYGSTFFELQPNSQLEIIISPIDGYELHKVYLGGRLEVAPYNSVSNELGIQDLGDGRYKIAYSMDRFRYWWNDREDPSYTITFKQKALPTWTVVQTGNTIESEMVLTRGDSGNDTVACTTPFTTQAFDTDIQKATLRVATTGGASEYSVYLVNSGSNKVTVIGVVRELTGMGLKEAKALVDSADGITPILVKTFATAAEAQAAQEALETAGATVQVEGDGTPTRVFRDGVDVTEQGLVDSGYLCYEVTADNLANTTWMITTEKVVIPGDVNGDGEVNTLDVMSIYNIMKQ